MARWYRLPMGDGSPPPLPSDLVAELEAVSEALAQRPDHADLARRFEWLLDALIMRGQLPASFRRLGLIDEYRIYVHPVLVGRGKLLFRETDAMTPLRLLESRTFGNGVVLLRYSPEPDAGHAEGR